MTTDCANNSISAQAGHSIPPNRKHRPGFNKRLYRLRWRIENAFDSLKAFRRIAAPYDRLAGNCLASVYLAAALVWRIK
jgi:transposase